MKTRSAFTLIELLIVVAIIAIFSAATLAVVTAPLADYYRAQAEKELNTGFGLFHASLLSDLRTSSGVSLPDDGSLLIHGVGPAQETIRYHVDERSILRRTRENTDSTALLNHVTSVSFSEDEPFVAWELEASFTGWHRTLSIKRSGRLTRAAVYGVDDQ